MRGNNPAKVLFPLNYFYVLKRLEILRINKKFETQQIELMNPLQIKRLLKQMSRDKKEQAKFKVLKNYFKLFYIEFKQLLESFMEFSLLF